jgi:phosphatidylethanolamine/phosphatidyl-N-methylethanolamine N-methyltransferase
MPGWWEESRTFWREYRANYKHTGAVLPSGRRLGRALATFVRERSADATGGLKILEIGPGTGAVTRQLCSALQPGDELDLCELNTTFVELLRRRLVGERPFSDVADCVRIFHQPIEQLDVEGRYDLVVSCLPLNNFQVNEVEAILGQLPRLLRPGGTLSFFQYIGIRKLKAITAGADDRKRLSGIARAMDAVLAGEIRRDHVWVNVPPAYVHHVRFGADTLR